MGLLWNIQDRSRGGCADRAKGGGWGWGWGWVVSVLMSLLIVGVREKKKKKKSWVASKIANLGNVRVGEGCWLCGGCVVDLV